MDTKKNLKDALDGQIEPNYDEVIDSFDDMGLKPELLRGVYAYGFERPSALQQRAILPITRGRNVIAQSQSGTGTTTISISVLQKIDPSIQQCQALVLTPTRELAQKMLEAIIAIGSFMSIKCHACIGGNRAFPDSPQVVVGTPGRIQGMAQKGLFQNNSLKIIVLNEADEMLSRGFDEQIYDIFQLLPPAQTILFSATIPQDVLQITTKLMGDPVRIVAKEDKPLKGMKQFYITVGGEEFKLHALSNLLRTLTQTTRTIVFGNTRRKVEELTKKLSVHDLAISAMHGDMDAVQRAGIIEDFRSGSSHILIATNLLARGLDVQSVSLVVNYDLPGKLEDYIHRLCRKGFTINFISGDEDPKMHEFEQFYNTETEEMPANVGDLI